MTRSVASAPKKKRKQETDKKEGSLAAKQAMVEHLTVGSSKPERKFPSPRIFKVEDSSSDAMNLYD